METFLKINLLLVLFYLMYHLFLEPLKLLKWNRFFLISSLFIALLLPFFNYEIKQINVVEKIESNFVYENNQKITNKSINVKAEPPFKINDVLLIKVIYSLVILFFVIKLLVGLLKILKLYQTGDKQRIKTFEVILNDKITEPFSFIKIFFPKKQIDNEHYVLLHEFAHCKQFHFIDILLINIFLAIFWINPFVWFLKKKFQLNLEYLADDFVLENEKDKKSYQLSLLSFLNQSTDLNIISLAYNQPPILKRIKMMNTKTNKRSYWKFFMILPILTGFFLFFQQEVKAITIEKSANSFEKKNDIKVKESFLINHLMTNKLIEKKLKYFNEKYKTTFKLDLIKRNENNQVIYIKVFSNKIDYLELANENGISDLLIAVKKDDNSALNVTMRPVGTVNQLSNSLISYDLQEIDEDEAINKNNTFLENLSEIKTTIIKNTDKENDVKDFLKRAQKMFDVKLSLKKIKYNQGKIVFLSINYDDSQGKKDDFVIENNLGIDDVIIKLQRPMNSKFTTYTILSKKEYKFDEPGDNHFFPDDAPKVETSQQPPTNSLLRMYNMVPPTPPTSPTIINSSGNLNNFNQVQHNLSKVRIKIKKDDILKEIEKNTNEINKYSTQIQFHSNLINQFSKKINKLTKQYEKNEKEINFYDKEIDKHSKEIDVLSAHIDKHSAIIDKKMIELDKE
jgi:beta-lactamase regulating signal transducer with metallopeptidase domain